jgi:hypothetical protein
MKMVLALALCLLSLIAPAQQANSAQSALFVNGHVGQYSAPVVCSSMSVDVQLQSTVQNATFEIWGSPGNLQSSVTVCSPFTTELDTPNAVLLWTGTINPFCGCAVTYYTCPGGVSLDLTIQAVVYFSGGCGFSISAATHIVTP